MATPNMNMELPVEDDDDGIWDTKLNQCLEDIDAHDHSTGKGVPVPTAGLDIDDDLSFGGFSAVDLRGVTFTRQVTFAPENGSLATKDSDGGLYWTDYTGTSWKLADATGINVALVGGITGDYAAAGASFYYDDAGKVYRALQSAPTPNVWASVAAGDIYLYEKASGISNKITLKSPAALAASYTLTLPGALPGSTLLMQVSSSGVVTFSNTVASAATFSGLITASAGVTAAANQHVTVSGTGEYKHGEYAPLQLGASCGGTDADSQWKFFASTGASPSRWAGGAGGAGVNVSFAIPLRVGDRIKGVRAKIKDTSGSHTVGMLLMRATGAGANTQTGSTQTSAGDGTNQTLTLSGLTSVIAAGDFYNIVIRANDATDTTHTIYGVEVDWDRP